MKIAVTGCSGYIGGQTAIHLSDNGHSVIGVDLRPLPDHLFPYLDTFVQEDISTVGCNAQLWQDVDAIVHCAGTSLVGPSIKDPAEYYYNNPGKTAKFLQDLHKSNWHGHLVFSSSAAVYGDSNTSRGFLETDPVCPINPYGQSKLMCEQVIDDCAVAYQFSATIFRYFNAAGADRLARHGQEKGDTHLVSRICESAAGFGEFELYGNQYPTNDGTCIRDYIHVVDLANAHMLAAIRRKPGVETYNLGTSYGVSVLEVIREVEQVSGTDCTYRTVQQRAGDPAVLVANGFRFTQEFNTMHKNSHIRYIVKDAWSWYQSATFKDKYNVSDILR